MQNKCFTLQVVYKAVVTNSTDKELRIYYSLTKATFKERQPNHKASFNNRNNMKNTELSKYIRAK